MLTFSSLIVVIACCYYFSTSGSLHVLEEGNGSSMGVVNAKLPEVIISNNQLFYVP